MRTIKLSTAYQLVLTALLLGACLGAVGRRLPTTISLPVQSVQAKAAIDEGAAFDFPTDPTAGESPEMRTYTHNVPAASTAPFAVVGEEPVKFRSAPGLHGLIVGSATHGQTLQIVGRDQGADWWLVCCLDGQAVWVAAALVAVNGSTANVHVIEATSGAAESIPLVSSAVNEVGSRSALLPAAMTQPLAPAPVYPFELAEQRQHGEQLVPRLYLYVHAGTTALGNYRVRVEKDGQLLPVTTLTASGAPEYTWPVTHERQQLTNLKVEFPTLLAAGKWTVQLLDEYGVPVSPVATFTLTADDLNKEMYVRYELE